MKGFWSRLIAFWNSLPPKVQQWLKGAEVAVVTAVVSAFIAAPASNFTTKKGVAEFVAGVASAAYGALRLYLTQSPVSVLVKKTFVSKTEATDGVSKTITAEQTVTSGGAAANVPANNTQTPTSSQQGEQK